MIRIENVTKCYNDKKAVDGLSLHVRAGELYGFIGHNGAGKTTTLKACCGILDFEKGDIFVDGVSVKKDPLACKKKLAYIPDDPVLYGFMTGIQYLHFVGDIYEVAMDVRMTRIRTYSSAFELTDALAQPISTYSHGMKQKLAVIAAFLHDPKVVIMDEPFVGLDPKASHILKETMREHCHHGGAIFFSTHVLEVAEKLCDKIAVIKQGKLVKAGTMDEVIGETTLENIFLELVE